LLTRGLIYEFKGAYDLAIRDYDQVLQLNPRDERAIMKLGRAYARQGSYNRAIQYYDELIRLLPDCDWCFSSRGGLYRAKGEYDRAIQDYDRALQLNPRSVVATASRGMAMFEQGQFAPAERHLTHALQLNPKCIQCNILRYLAQARGGQDSSSSLSSLSTNADRNKWPDLIAFLYLGKVTAEAVLEAATDPDPMEQLNKQCSAYFYIGESLLIQGQTDEAVRLFRAAVEIKAFDVAECIAAKAELKRLGY
jgi:lipoprotein NlpI